MHGERMRCAATSAMLVAALGCETGQAADSGFYVGAAAAHVEQELDRQAGVGPVLNIQKLPDPGAPFQLPIPPAPIIATYAPAGGFTADETDVGWNVTLGYRLNRYLAAEIAYIDAGEASLGALYSVPDNLPVPVVTTVMFRRYIVNPRGPALTVLGTLPLRSGWEVFLRGGVWQVEQEVELETTVGLNLPPGRYQRDFDDQVLNVGVGVQWAFLPRWTARLEYQRTADLQANDVMGESRIEQATISVLFGL